MMAEKLLSILLVVILIMISMVGCTFDGSNQTKEVEFQIGDGGRHHSIPMETGAVGENDASVELNEDYRNIRFYIDGTEAAARAFMREIYGNFLLNLPEWSTHSVTKYEMISFALKTSSDTSVTAEFSFGVEPRQDIYFIGLNTQRGTGKYEGQLILKKSFTLEKDSEGYWNCTRLEDVYEDLLYEIGEVYKKAVEAYGWFDLTTMPTAYDTDGDVRDHEGQQYFRVVHETIKTLADLENYLRSLFSDNIVANLLFPEEGEKRYRDFDGIFYAIPADRGTDINKGEETYEVVQDSGNNRITFRVTVELLGDWDGNKQPVTGYETHDFICEKIDGRWIFSSFGLVR